MSKTCCKAEGFIGTFANDTKVRLITTPLMKLSFLTTELGCSSSQKSPFGSLRGDFCNWVDAGVCDEWQHGSAYGL